MIDVLKWSSPRERRCYSLQRMRIRDSIEVELMLEKLGVLVKKQ